MNDAFSGFRRIKGHVHGILADRDWEGKFIRLLASGVSAQRTISPLFAALYSPSRIIRWHAVTCFGIAAEELAEQGREHVRVVLRRCTWSLNDESGGIGWGAPETMGEILARIPALSGEYASILISFVLERDQACNFLEYAPLREGAYWGIARLAQADPQLFLPWRDLILDATECETSPAILANAALVLSRPEIASDRANRFRSHLASRPERVVLYWNKAFWDVALSDLAENQEPPESTRLPDSALEEPA